MINRDMTITLSWETPAALAFKNLYDTTGWGPVERETTFYADALRGSWASVAVYDGVKLVAFARVISDGKLHAFIRTIRRLRSRWEIASQTEES